MQAEEYAAGVPDHVPAPVRPQRARELGLPDADDVVYVALAMFDDYAHAFSKMMRKQRGPITRRKRAILAAEQDRTKKLEGGSVDEVPEAAPR